MQQCFFGVTDSTGLDFFGDVVLRVSDFSRLQSCRESSETLFLHLSSHGRVRVPKEERKKPSFFIASSLFAPDCFDSGRRGKRECSPPIHGRGGDRPPACGGGKEEEGKEWRWKVQT